ncbi:PfkB family carbohydrate kinase [Caulobacter sp. KR2-114]|uniref:PfkB family carbohydrate kinase n=1 Tax=Caulobacter sp. KR2-114 TaxID=3400912 RepID=UPI003C05DEA9
MPAVLILSSYVAVSRVGGGAQALALARLGVEPILIPTVLFGRHPGWGPPGGAPVEAAVMQAMLEAVEAQGRFRELAAVITGHFSTPEQVAVAARALDAVRAANPDAGLVVDPVMGDEGKGLYVSPAVADALVAQLLPRADLIAPNAWELERLSGCKVTDPASAAFAARIVRKPTLVSSVVDGGQLGVVYADAAGAVAALHPRSDSAPNGTGDLLTALFTAGLALDLEPNAALLCAASGVAEAVAAAGGLDELPLQAFPSVLGVSQTVRVELIGG